jgi:hypothetical protein
MANNTFVVSVADAIVRDPNTQVALMLAKANIDSALTITMTETQIRGGISNPILFDYVHDRKLAVKLTQATMNEQILALNAGTTSLNTTVTALQTDFLTLSASGSGTCTQTPTGSVSVIVPNGTIQTVVPTGSTFTSAGNASAQIYAVYPYSVVADQIPIQAVQPPSVVDLTLIAQVRDSTNTIVNYLQIWIPKFQILGNYTLALTANGVSNQALDGVALVTPSTNANYSDYYALVTWVPTSSTTIPVFAVAAAPTVLTFSVAAGLPASKQVNLYGLRGSLYGNTNLTTSASYTRTSGCTCFTCGSNSGIITAASGTTYSGCSAVFTATYYDATSGSLTSLISVSATA